MSEFMEDSGLSKEDLSELAANFKQYKSTGDLPDIFGRDVPYDHELTPQLILQEEVQHLHLKEEESDWTVRTIQFNRTSDSHLVYCQGFTNPDSYLFIVLFSQNAHEEARNRNIMALIGDTAERFRQLH